MLCQFLVVFSEPKHSTGKHYKKLLLFWCKFSSTSWVWSLKITPFSFLTINILNQAASKQSTTWITLEMLCRLLEVFSECSLALLESTHLLFDVHEDVLLFLFLLLHLPHQDTVDQLCTPGDKHNAQEEVSLFPVNMPDLIHIRFRSVRKHWPKAGLMILAHPACFWIHLAKTWHGQSPLGFQLWYSTLISESAVLQCGCQEAILFDWT